LERGKSNSEKHFEQRYSESLAGARTATVRNVTSFGVAAGCALSSYLVMMAVGIVYGSFRLADEMEDSAFDFMVPLPQGRYNHFCANSKNEFLSNITSSSLSGACPGPARPFQMACSIASAFSQVGVASLGFENLADFHKYLPHHRCQRLDYYDDDDCFHYLKQ